MKDDGEEGAGRCKKGKRSLGEEREVKVERVREREGGRESQRVECCVPGNVRQIDLIPQDATFRFSHSVVFFKGRQRADRYIQSLTSPASPLP